MPIRSGIYSKKSVEGNPRSTLLATTAACAIVGGLILPEENMPVSRTLLATCLTILFCSAMLVSAATAQIIQLGGSDAEIKARLSAQGYDRIDIVDRGLSSSTYHVCYGRQRIEFKVYWDGRTGGRKVIGGCRLMVSIDQARNILARQGFERINIEDRGGAYLAIACRGPQRLRVRISYQGDIGDQRQLGSCAEELSPTDITAQLEREGYDRIRFTDRQLPKYVATACNGPQQLELAFDRFGREVSRKEIGRCRGPVAPVDLLDILADLGFKQIRVTDPNLPRYKAEACRGKQRLEITLNRFGEVTDQVRLGDCRDAITKRQLERTLARQGYRQVRVADNGRDGFVASGCLNDRRTELTVSRFGEVVHERGLGPCRSLTVEEVRRQLSGDGFDSIEFYAEACRRGRKLQLQIDDYGQIEERDRIGRC